MSCTDEKKPNSEIDPSVLNHKLAQLQKTVYGIDMSLTNPGLVKIDPSTHKVSLYYFRNRQIEHNALVRVSDHRSSFYGWFWEVVCIEEEKDLSQYSRFSSKISKLMALIGDNFNKTSCVGIEGYSMNSRTGKSGTILMELGGCLRLALATYEHKWVEIPPRSVKKQFTGNGKADKNEMYQYYLQKYHLPELCNLIGLKQIYKQTPHPVEDLVDALADGLSTLFSMTPCDST